LSHTIIPLALPKGTERFCELCQKRAYLECTGCHVTFYCDEDHQQADWVGIHERICQLLIPIRTQTLSQTGRSEILYKKLITICKSEAERKIAEGKHQEALPAAQFFLRCSTDVNGPSAVQLVPAYLLLAEANTGLGDLVSAMEFLSQAEWVVLKSPDCGHEILHRLHRSQGRLHTALGYLESARKHFANDIYHASEEYGADSIISCEGYFLLASVFVKEGKMPVVRSLYSQVKYNTYIMPHMYYFGHSVHTSFCLFFWQVEVDKTLTAILEFVQCDVIADLAQVVLVAHSLSMLWFLRGDSVKVSSVTEVVFDTVTQLHSEKSTATETTNESTLCIHTLYHSLNKV
uniref:Zinc finger, MYND-type containing 12 n=1 Tax=Sphaeramia orbicularis TaxID=375764 RepID=A0A673AUP0_9TELE